MSNQSSTSSPPLLPAVRPSGLDLAREGATLVDVLYPEPRERRAASLRIARRARVLLDDATRRDAGFLLFGLSEALAGRAMTRGGRQ